MNGYLDSGFHVENLRHSCLRCRKRKVRCDRILPCSNCIRSQVQCVFPEGIKKRRPKESHTHITDPHTHLLNDEVLSRIEKLEQKLDHLSQNGSFPPAVDYSLTNASILVSADSIPTTTFSLSEDFGRLAVHKGKSRYVSSKLWQVLADEAKEMENVLDSSASEEEGVDDDNEKDDDGEGKEGQIESAWTTNFIFNGSLFGHRSHFRDLSRFHPPEQKALYLVMVYEKNIAPLVPILHWPTMRGFIIDTIEHKVPPNKNLECLVFAIYFAATTSLSPNQCYSNMGVTRDVILNGFRCAIQHAITRANILNTQSLELLQGVVLFLTAVRQVDDTKFVWSMTGLVVRISQGLGLHRDGSLLGLMPFDTEMRRRLWWHIVLLDMRSSEEQGTDQQIFEGSYDTLFPSNVDDNDIYPKMKSDPLPRTGCFTGMTFALIRCEVARALSRVTSTIATSRPNSSHSKFHAQQENEEIYRDIADCINKKYISVCDKSIPMQRVCILLARLVLANLWIVVFIHGEKRPGNVNNNNLDYIAQGASPQCREKLIITSLQIIETTYALESRPDTYMWSWLFRANAHWSYVAFVLSELCLRPSSQIAQQAWNVINLVQDKWKLTSGHRKGMLWRPIRHLMHKATIIHTEQLMAISNTDGMLASNSTLVEEAGKGKDLEKPYLTVDKHRRTVTSPTLCDGDQYQDAQPSFQYESNVTSNTSMDLGNAEVIPATDLLDWTIVSSMTNWNYL
ncbi:fungal-specific transcription factor domain-containing protein [Talaromyces proteolyticus]|uniref:Fungal-specific transcription factor domain-containing protein n=1 Tax=Talaromyces proteolyticus TaxID=1131652 RepID=A0AAD4KWV9_9EURO|nr:fungal-specific transcription factor domain-containing protein [Talaromyces proteolyticus]KAH8703016.1 fungal-specific transcription factor domain-containing protein [Talaromyces proteolyticus]